MLAGWSCSPSTRSSARSERRSLPTTFALSALPSDNLTETSSVTEGRSASAMLRKDCESFTAVWIPSSAGPFVVSAGAATHGPRSRPVRDGKGRDTLMRRSPCSWAAPATVERRLRLVRKRWENDFVSAG
jgi:hypothetical protein